MAAAIWEVNFRGDLAANSARAADTVEQLRKETTLVGEAFKRSNASLKPLNVDLKTARDLFKASSGNISVFKAALKDAGTSALDTRLLVGKMNAELAASRKEALGLGGNFWERIFNPRHLWAFSHGLNVLSKGFGALKTVASGVAGVVGTVFDAGKGFADLVLESATFRENALSGLESAFGSKEEALSAFKYAQDFARETPLDTDKVISGIQKLATQGFSREEAQLLYKSVADIQSVRLGDESAQDKVIDAFSRLRGRGSATGEDLESLRVAGFRAKDVVGELVKNEGLAPLFKQIEVPGLNGEKTKRIPFAQANELQIAHHAKSVLGKGVISDTTLLNAALASQENRPGALPLGETAAKFGQKSLTGTISNAKAAFGDLLKSFDLADTEGVKSIQKFLSGFAEALKPGKAGAEAIKEAVVKMSDALFGSLGKIDEGKITSFITTIGKFGTAAIETIKQAWDWLDKLVSQASTGSFVDAIKQALIDVGSFIGRGLVQGATFAVKEGAKSLLPSAGLPSLREGISAAGALSPSTAPLFEGIGALYDGVKARLDDTSAKLVPQFAQTGEDAAFALKFGWSQALEQHSPSRVMMRLGEQAAKSLITGAERGSAGAAGAVRGGGNTFEINIDARGGDGASVEEAVRRVLLPEMTQLLERVGAEG